MSSNHADAAAKVLDASDYYAIFDLDQASELRSEGAKKALRSKWRELSHLTHPDKSHDPRGLDAFKQLQKAYQTLSNDEEREQYDATLARANSRASEIVGDEDAARVAEIKEEIRRLVKSAAREALHFVRQALEWEGTHQLPMRVTMHFVGACGTADAAEAALESLRGLLVQYEQNMQRGQRILNDAMRTYQNTATEAAVAALRAAAAEALELGVPPRRVSPTNKIANELYAHLQARSPERLAAAAAASAAAGRGSAAMDEDEDEDEAAMRRAVEELQQQQQQQQQGAAAAAPGSRRQRRAQPASKPPRGRAKAAAPAAPAPAPAPAPAMEDEIDIEIAIPQSVEEMLAQHEAAEAAKEAAAMELAAKEAAAKEAASIRARAKQQQAAPVASPVARGLPASAGGAAASVASERSSSRPSSSRRSGGEGVDGAMTMDMFAQLLVADEAEASLEAVWEDDAFLEAAAMEQAMEAAAMDAVASAAATNGRPVPSRAAPKRGRKAPARSRKATSAAYDSSDDERGRLAAAAEAADGADAQSSEEEAVPKKRGYVGSQPVGLEEEEAARPPKKRGGRRGAKGGEAQPPRAKARKTAPARARAPAPSPSAAGSNPSSPLVPPAPSPPRASVAVHPADLAIRALFESEDADGGGGAEGGGTEGGSLLGGGRRRAKSKAARAAEGDTSDEDEEKDEDGEGGEGGANDGDEDYAQEDGANDDDEEYVPAIMRHRRYSAAERAGKSAASGAGAAMSAAPRRARPHGSSGSRKVDEMSLTLDELLARADAAVAAANAAALKVAKAAKASAATGSDDDEDDDAVTLTYPEDTMTLDELSRASDRAEGYRVQPALRPPSKARKPSAERKRKRKTAADDSDELLSGDDLDGLALDAAQHGLDRLPQLSGAERRATLVQGREPRASSSMFANRRAGRGAPGLGASAVAQSAAYAAESYTYDGPSWMLLQTDSDDSDGTASRKKELKRRAQQAKAEAARLAREAAAQMAAARKAADASASTAGAGAPSQGAAHDGAPPAGAPSNKAIKSAPARAATHGSEDEAVEDAEEGEFEVEALLLERAPNRYSTEVTFRVRWKGFDEDEDTWEPESSLPPHLVAQFRERRAHERALAFAAKQAEERVAREMAEAAAVRRQEAAAQSAQVRATEDAARRAKAEALREARRAAAEAAAKEKAAAEAKLAAEKAERAAAKRQQKQQERQHIQADGVAADGMAAAGEVALTASTPYTMGGGGGGGGVPPSSSQGTSDASIKEVGRTDSVSTEAAGEAEGGSRKRKASIALDEKNIAKAVRAQLRRAADPAAVSRKELREALEKQLGSDLSEWKEAIKMAAVHFVASLAGA